MVSVVQREVGVEVRGLRNRCGFLERSKGSWRCASPVKVGKTFDGLIISPLSRILFRLVVLINQHLVEREGGRNLSDVVIFVVSALFDRESAHNRRLEKSTYLQLYLHDREQYQ